MASMRLQKFCLICLMLFAGLAAGCGVTLKGPGVIMITSTLSPAMIGVPYSAKLTASGGVPPYKWSVASGTLPPGLSLSSAGMLSGTPTVAGAFKVTFQVNDSGGGLPSEGSQTSTFTVGDSPIVIGTASPLTPGTLNIPYLATLSASGGIAPYSWSVTAGNLPAGLALSSNGVLSGTPAAPGTSTFTVQVSDSASTPQTATASLTLVIGVATLAVTTTSLPSGKVGTAYSAQLMVSGGVPPYAWSVNAGTTGLLSGTPGSVSNTSPTFTVMDSDGNSASASLALTIQAAGGTVPDNYYSFVFAGTAPQGSPVAASGIAMNGIIKISSGKVVSGFYDENFNAAAPVLKASISGGSLVLGANGLGQLVLTTASKTMIFALAIPASVSTGGLTPIRMIEYDDSTGTGSRGSGVIDPTPPNPTTQDILGSFAFLLSGTDLNQNQQALIGSFQTDGAGNIKAGEADANQVVPVNGVPTREVAYFSSLGGSYSLDTDSRGLLTFTIGGGSFHFSFYEVSPQEWLVISLDPATLNSPLVSGIAYQQSGAPFSTASLPALSVLEVSGVVPASGATTPLPDISLGLATSDGNGNVAYTFDEYDGSLTSGSSTVPYSVDATTGRTTAIAGAATQPILYIINNTSAFYLGVGQSGQSGMIEAQTGAPFNAASFSGDYLGGSLPLALTSVLNESGLVAADGGGNVTFTTNRSSSAGLAYQNDVVSGTYTMESNGRCVVTAPDGLTRIFYLMSPTNAAYLTSDGGGYLGSFAQ
jgi:Putative Ig domain